MNIAEFFVRMQTAAGCIGPGQFQHVFDQLNALQDRRRFLKTSGMGLGAAALGVSPLLLASARSASLAVVIVFVVLTIAFLVLGRLELGLGRTQRADGALLLLPLALQRAGPFREVGQLALQGLQSRGRCVVIASPRALSAGASPRRVRSRPR